MFRRFFFTLFIFSISSVWSQNIMISDTNFPNEPSIMMDPIHPNILVAAANINNYFISSDTGRTWEIKTLTSTYGVWGDPVIDVDTSGNFYFFHLSNPTYGYFLDRIVCQKSEDGGHNWNNGSSAGLNGDKDQDKHWSIVNRKNNHIYLTWTQFDEYGSLNPNHKSSILFSKSLDSGDSWSKAKKINVVDGNCEDRDSTVEGAVPAIGPFGALFVSWAGPNGIVFNRSIDEGETWLKKEILIDSMPGGWVFDIPGISRCNGLPITKCDLSGGPNHGTIYVNWTDQRNGLDDTDVWLSKSRDGGNTWSSPQRVNDDPPGRHQFLTWMDIDQTNGNLFFIFYDRRATLSNETEIYLAKSIDGGNSFLNIEVKRSRFLPNSGVFFGDYTNIVAHNNIVRPIWTSMVGGKTRIWTNISTEESLFVEVDEEIEDNYDVEQYPNPVSNFFYFSYKLRKRSLVDLSIFDISGRQVWVECVNEEKDYGKYVVQFDLNKMSLKRGTYFCKLVVNNKEKVVKKIIVN